MNAHLKALIEGAYQHLLENIVFPRAIAEGAACNIKNSELFFSEDKAEQAQAKAICMGCPVRALCADHWLNQEVEGIFGGLDERERKRLRAGSPAFTFDEINLAIVWQRDLCCMKAPDFAAAHGVTEKTYFRYRSALKKNGFDLSGQMPKRIAKVSK